MDIYYMFVNVQYMCTVRILMYVLNVLYMQRWESMHITYECNSKCEYVHYAT